MGFWKRLFRNGSEKRGARIGPADLFRELFTGRPAKSGVSVTWENSLEVTTVLACARVIAEDVAGMPRGVYKKNAGNRILFSESPIQTLLDFPNDWQTGEELVEQLTMHAVLTGNGIAVKNTAKDVRSGKLVIKELLPLQPRWYQIEQDDQWNVIVKVTLPDGGPPMQFSASDLLILRGPSWNGFAGLDIVKAAREAIGLSVALEESHARLHRNGVQASGVFSVKDPLGEEQYKRLKASIEAQFTGAGQFNPIIMDRGGTFTKITMSGVDAEHIATRKNQVEEICRTMRVFPMMVGHSDKASTFASSEQFFLAHVKYSLLPWVRRWESAFRRDLIGKSASNVYVKHNVAALERADIKTRYDAYQSGIQAGWMLRSDARELEDMPPVTGLDRPILPMNTSVLDAQGNPISSKPAGNS